MKRNPKLERLTRDGIAWLEFLRSPLAGEAIGGSLTRRIILFGQYLDNLPLQDGDIGVIDDFLLYEKVQLATQ